MKYPRQANVIKKRRLFSSQLGGLEGTALASAQLWLRHIIGVCVRGRSHLTQREARGRGPGALPYHLRASHEAPPLLSPPPPHTTSLGTKLPHQHPRGQPTATQRPRVPPCHHPFRPWRRRSTSPNERGLSSCGRPGRPTWGSLWKPPPLPARARLDRGAPSPVTAHGSLGGRGPSLECGLL